MSRLADFLAGVTTAGFVAALLYLRHDYQRKLEGLAEGCDERFATLQEELEDLQKQHQAAGFRSN